MVLKIYQFLTIVFSPIIDLFLLIRLYLGKEDKKRFLERLGFSNAKRPKGDIIWFQCASVGEGNSVLPLIEEIIKKYDNNITILITSGTVTSANTIANKIKNKNNIIHQYTPVDKYFAIKRFLKFWKPKTLITVESEIWPNMITLSHKYCEKVMIVNAKMSERSFKRWKMFKNLKESIFDSIDICYPQSEEDQYRFINLGIQSTRFIGNLKFDIPKLSVNESYLNFIRNDIGNRKVVLCASLHSEEKEIIEKIYSKLKRKYKDILFILALRHIQKNEEIANFLREKKYNISIKSKNEKINNDTNFFIFDEMNSMGTLFEYSKIVLMCGSLIDKIGGHTPVEPAKQSCAIITGPFIANNKSLFREFEKEMACLVCKKKHNIDKELVKHISFILDNKNEEIKLRENASIVCEKFQNVAKNVANDIFNSLKNS